jgi:prepilin-type N-terminal cleavage/methylation domain-containing protein
MRQDRRGFTLMELMTVVVIIAILAAISVPNINLGRIRLNGAMQAVGTTLLACQREAVARQYNVIVMFDVTGRALRILYDNNNNNVQDGGERIKVIPLESEAVFGRAGATPRAFGSNPVNFTRTVNGFPAVIFYRSGSLSEAGGFYLTSVKAAAGVTKNLSDTRAIELIRATGRAEWYRYNSGGGTWNRGF